ncbi:hypothetical protein L3Q65_18300 [Amycolatopsis sp. FU40]|uniref:hypothetical protein n=1 Tax=Amycolatopsis sp. FU40 TaxID=2914159 RepID=UPI001F179151|nr:hypothetical protein [Amycolatopsis sp. FU40]UKD58589.1 hypothetical protein L3Q65_18300 [Amycolatopsis sp. FU40]
MPGWLQIILPIVTALLGGGVGFGFGRLGKALDRRQDRKDAEAARVLAEQMRRPAFAVEHVKGTLYRLVNVGDADATRVHFSDRDESYAQIQYRPERVTLGIGAAHEFGILTTDALPLPGRVLVMCDQFDEPVPARVPL